MLELFNPLFAFMGVDFWPGTVKEIVIVLLFAYALLLGFVTNMIMKDRGFGTLLNMLLCLAGACLGIAAYTRFIGIDRMNFDPVVMAAGAGGAILFMLLLGLLKYLLSVMGGSMHVGLAGLERDMANRHLARTRATKDTQSDRALQRLNSLKR
jgi:uncharacterized membrane protein YeaQ/YmgE (transglycosylase-associated protein family)